MPPAAMISSSARSKPCFHCVPYCAFGPVSGPLTPSRIGSELSAKAAWDMAPAIMAASEPLTRVRRSSLLMHGSIQSGITIRWQFACQRNCLFRGLPERQHQPVRPVEERRTVDDVDDLGIVEPRAAKLRDIVGPERDRRRGERHRRLDHRVPARAEIGPDALVEQALHVVAALGVGAGKARMHGGAIDAAVVTRGRSRRELSLGAW